MEKPGLTKAQLIGLPLGVAAFLALILIPTPDGLSPEAQRIAALAALMAIWWVTEAIPIYATALLPILLLPLLGISAIEEAASPYAEPTIFLFLGGFFLATAMQRWGLHKRISLYTIGLLGTEPRMLLLGFMMATAVMSMWVSNTATAMMVFPIGLALLDRFGLDRSSDASPSPQSRFAKALMLGIAYAASIGGVGTLIGTPPNAIFAGESRLLFPELPEITFLKWMLIGIPYVLLFLPLAWAYLAFIGARGVVLKEADISIKQEIAKLGRPGRGEVSVFVVFCLAVIGWLTRREFDFGLFVMPGWSSLLGVGDLVGDASVAILAALLLFAIPVNLKRGEFVLNWEWASKIPWGVLILFGGGFSLAFGFQETGLASWLGQGLAGLTQMPLPLFILLLCLLVTLFGELASNTALAVLMIPILGATANEVGAHPYLFIIPATLAASSGFMLPVATPPNAIVFGSGVLKIGEMARAGLAMNLLGAVLITAIMFLVVIPLFGLQ